MRHHWARMTAGLLLLLLATVVSPQARAQEPGDSSVEFSVTPSRLEVRLSPGESLQFAIQVINHSHQPLTMLTYIDDIDIPPDELLASDELAFTASRWVKFGSDQIEVPGQGIVEAIVIADIPEDTPTGGYHAVGYFQAVRPEPSAGTEIAALGRIGATLLLEVTPTEVGLAREARVAATDLEVGWEGLFTPRVSAEVVLENLGDLHFTAGGIHTYRVWPGQGSHEEKVGPVTLLRGTRHTFGSSLLEAPLFGRVGMTSEIVYQVGPNDLPVIITQASVWVIPWHLIVPVLAVGLAAGGFLFLRRRAGKRLQRASFANEKSNNHVTTEV